LIHRQLKTDPRVSVTTFSPVQPFLAEIQNGDRDYEEHKIVVKGIVTLSRC